MFNEVASQRVMRLANVNSEHVIVDAFFVGWSQHTPLLFWEKVYLDQNVTLSIKTQEQVLPARALPYTTLAATQELIEGNTSRTKAVAAKWATAVPNIHETEADWRWIEFLIKSTSADFSYRCLIGSGRAGSARNGGERAGAQPGRVVADAMRARGSG